MERRPGDEEPCVTLTYSGGDGEAVAEDSVGVDVGGAVLDVVVEGEANISDFSEG